DGDGRGRPGARNADGARTNRDRSLGDADRGARGTLMRDVLTPRKIRLAEDKRRTNAPVMASIIREIGRCGLVRSKRADPFIAIVDAIIWQQLSGKAARTIYERFLKIFPKGRANAAT